MNCSLGCGPTVSPAIGMANLTGKTGTKLAGSSGQYALCHYHFEEVKSGRWGTVELRGWEPFPEFMNEHRKDQASSDVPWTEETESTTP